VNTFIHLIRRLQAAVFGASTSSPSTAAQPARAKLAGRRGYGDDGTPTPRP
jgi:hypothetical protein